MDISRLAQRESAGGGRLGSHRDIDDWRIIRGRGRLGVGPAAVNELDVILHAFEPQHSGTVARVFLGRDSADLGHEEGGRRERLLDVGDVIARNPQATVDDVEGLLGQASGEAVGGVEDANIEVGVGCAAEIGL